MANAQARVCVFCGGSPVTKEHVWPQWINKHMIARFGPIAGNWEVKRGEGTWKTALGATVSRVCKTCNEGWMSKLEEDARPIIVPVMIAEQWDVPLTPGAQVTLATWAMKTALLADLFYPIQSFSESHYSGFFADKRPPKEGCSVWVGAFRNERGRLSSQVGVVNGAAFGVPFTGAMATLGVFCLVLQVLVHDAFKQGGIATLPMGSGTDSTFTHRIWPTSGKTVLWPPHRNAFDEAGLSTFTTRGAPWTQLTRKPDD